MTGLEIGGIELLIPAIVAAIVVAVRNVSASLDGPRAYWVGLALNVAAQVVAELVAGDGSGSVAGAAALGLGTGAVVSPGLAATGKRLGAAKIVKPRRDS